MKILLIFVSLLIGLNLRYGLLIWGALTLAILLTLIIKKRSILYFVHIIPLLVGVGVSFIHLDFNKTTYNGLVIESKTNYFLFSSSFEKFYVYNKNNSYEIGDCLSISGNKSDLNFVTLESQFDFNDYLNKKGVYKQLYPSKIKVNIKNPLRINAIRNKFLSHFDEETSSLINAIMFSTNDRSETTNSFSYLHLSRLLSMSGLYLEIFIAFFSFFFKFKMKNKTARLLSFLLISPYLLITLPKFSIIRFITFFIARYVNEFFFKKKLSYPSLLGAIGIIFLILNPYLAYQDSFLLGFFIPIIIYFSKDITIGMTSFKKKAFTTGLVLIFFIPFELKYYQEFSFLSYPFQILFTPIFILIALNSLLCFYHIPLYSLSTVLCKTSSGLSKFLKPVFWSFHAPSFTSGLLIVFYAFIFVFIYYRSIKFKPLYRISATSFVVFICLYLFPIHNTLSGEVSFINVGQGDACLIRNRNRCLLIDTGGSIYQDIGKTVLIPYLKKKRIYQLDYVITTHDDYDHSGALSSLMSDFKVKNYINQKEDFPSTYIGITFTNYNFVNTDDTNESSLVIGFHFLGKDFLIMGDAPKSVEYTIMEENTSIQCDILKIGHHGSSTSTSYKFVDYIKPKEAVISVGRNNYGHPEESVINILEKRNIKIRRTDKEGTISYCGYLF